MTLITPKSRADMPELEPMFGMVEAAMGFVPESFLTMAHWPELLPSFAGFAGGILSGGTLEHGLKNLISFVVSNAAGCSYCQAHTSHTAQVNGVTAEKIQAAFEFETSPLFNDAERAALRVASPMAPLTAGLADRLGLSVRDRSGYALAASLRPL